MRSHGGRPEYVISSIHNRSISKTSIETEYDAVVWQWTREDAQASCNIELFTRPTQLFGLYYKENITYQPTGCQSCRKHDE
jgi:hypothetical protein